MRRFFFDLILFGLRGVHCNYGCQALEARDSLLHIIVSRGLACSRAVVKKTVHFLIMRGVCGSPLSKIRRSSKHSGENMSQKRLSCLLTNIEASKSKARVLIALVRSLTKHAFFNHGRCLWKSATQLQKFQRKNQK